MKRWEIVEKVSMNCKAYTYTSGNGQRQVCLIGSSIEINKHNVLPCTDSSQSGWSHVNVVTCMHVLGLWFANTAAACLLIMLEQIDLHIFYLWSTNTAASLCKHYQLPLCVNIIVNKCLIISIIKNVSGLYSTILGITVWTIISTSNTSYVLPRVDNELFGCTI